MLPSRSTTEKYVVSLEVSGCPASTAQFALSVLISFARFAAYGLEIMPRVGTFTTRVSATYFKSA